MTHPTLRVPLSRGGKTGSQYIEVDGIGPVLFERSRRAKRIIITVLPRNGVRVTVPARGSVKKAEKFVRSKMGWIQKQLSLIEQAEREVGAVVKEIDRVSARRMLLERLDHLSKKYDLTYNKAFIRNQRTRWGSCSAQNNISLNMKLVLLPEELRDYVILHELVHTRIKNHSKDFWAELDKYTGNAKALASELKKYGTALL
ncbi:MAG: SprT family zinc-dependent metalloprotease [Dehalococcoidia bacterium]